MSNIIRYLLPQQNGHQFKSYQNSCDQNKLVQLKIEKTNLIKISTETECLFFSFSIRLILSTIAVESHPWLMRPSDDLNLYMKVENAQEEAQQHLVSLYGKLF